MCKCDCGTQDVIVPGHALKSGNTSSCGCIKHKKETGKIIKDLVGKKFNFFTVIKFDKEKSKTKKQNFWLCKCDCGNSELISVSSTDLTKGYIHGCNACKNDRIGKSQTHHGMKYTRIYKLWSSMKSRCSNPYINGYENYGGKGIKVCDDWLKFEPFYNWAISNGYTDELTIDRINVYGNYEPDNCRWVTNKEQKRNMKKTIYVLYNNTTYVLLDLLEMLGRVDEYDKIRSRLGRNWTLEESLNIPFNLQRHYYYFIKALEAEFTDKPYGYSISKQEFLDKYIDDNFNKRFATYSNNHYIIDAMKRLNLQNKKFNITKNKEELYEN